MYSLPTGASGCKTLFTVVSVTQTDGLWRVFLKDFHDWLCVNPSTIIAVQPCWVVTSEPGVSTLTSLSWRSGPSGCPKYGGGVDIKVMNHPLTVILAGLAISSFCLRQKTVFWLDLLTKNDRSRLTQVKQLLHEIHASSRKVIVWDSKWWLRVLRDTFNIVLPLDVHVFDPGFVGWLRDPDKGRPSLLDELAQLGSELDLEKLKAMDFFTTEPPTQFCDWQVCLPHFNLSETSTQCPPIQPLKSTHSSTLQPYVNHYAAQCFLLAQWTQPERISDLHLPRALIELEMPCVTLLARIESYGFALNIPHLLDCRNKLIQHAELMERVAHRLAGRPFELNSPKEVSQVLFQWLNLPQLTDSSDHIAAKRRSHLALLSGRRMHARTSNLPRASNALLSRLSGLHPLPSLLMQWRHIHGVLEKAFHGLVSTCELVRTDDYKIAADSHPRLAPTYDTFTATGRIVSCLPNIQGVPKDIVIDYPRVHTPQESSLSVLSVPKTFRSLFKSCKTAKWPESISELLAELPQEPVIIRPRQSFCAARDSILISGDYCQLELRLLSHFSGDDNLRKLLAVQDPCSVEPNSISTPPPEEQDAFRKLAAYWLKSSSVTEVSAAQRQQAKQLCYAVIYGMGAQGLAAQLDITEGAAQSLIDSFLRAFPGVHRFITDTMQSAHNCGEVTTLCGRVRILSALQYPRFSSHPLALQHSSVEPLRQNRSQEIKKHFAVAKAERQAVNTVIQGSAAEIAKSAMLAIDQELTDNNKHTQCHLVLHEHDELIYEVTPAKAGPAVGSLIRTSMTLIGLKYNLLVPLPVKLRAGPNWAELEEVDW